MPISTPVLRHASACKAAAMALAIAFCTAATYMPAQTAPAPANSQVATSRPAPTPEQLAIQAASEKDHQRMMDLLGIKELRPGASASGNGPNPANYDESKANIYPNLPDPLLLNNGKRVTSAKVWWNDAPPANRRALRSRDSRPRSRESARCRRGRWSAPRRRRTGTSR